MDGGELIFRKLLPNDLDRVWEAIRYGLLRSLRLVADPEKALRNVLKALATGAAQAWVLIKKRPEGAEIHAVAVTAVQIDPLTGEKVLFGHSIFAYQVLTNEAWDLIGRKIDDFARSEGCAHVAAISDNPRFIERARALGAASFLFLFRRVST